MKIATAGGRKIRFTLRLDLSRGFTQVDQVSFRTGARC